MGTGRINLLLMVVMILGLSPAVRAGEGDEAGTEFGRILAEITSADQGSGPSEYTVSEEEFNAWLQLRTRDREYIHRIEAVFHDNNQTGLELDLDASQLEIKGYYPKMLNTLFEGHQAIKAEGEIKVEAGNFSFIVNNLTINEVHVTPALVIPLLSVLLPDYDLGKPLPLPYGISDIRTREGNLTISRAGTRVESAAAPG